jgi:hypothetical protein
VVTASFDKTARAVIDGIYLTPIETYSNAASNSGRIQLTG